MNASLKLSKDSMNSKDSTNEDKEDPKRELDALTAVGSVLFNLDAALTR